MTKKTPLTILSSSEADTRGKIHLESDGTQFMTGNTEHDYICGKCSAVLLKGVDQLNMLNGALRCNKCSTYNSLDKPSLYEEPPITINDLDNYPKATNTLRLSGIWATHKLANRFEDLHNKFMDKWQVYQTERPDIFYHYTDFQGLEGITNSGNVWATDLAYLNDASEMQLAIDLIEEYSEGITPNLNELQIELLRRSSVSTSPSSTASGFYVSCFCNNGDLLSQWRAYGAGGGGYALGFNANAIGNKGHLLVRKVIYEKEDQLSLVKFIVDGTLQLLDEISQDKSKEELDKDHSLPAISAFLSDHLREFLYTFKHKAFSEEDEWRVIFDFDRYKHMDRLKYRQSRGFPVPYVELPLYIPSKVVPKLPLVEIIHGPTLHPDLTKKSLHLLLQRCNYEFVEVRGSNAPLRT